MDEGRWKKIGEVSDKSHNALKLEYLLNDINFNNIIHVAFAI